MPMYQMKTRDRKPRRSSYEIDTIFTICDEKNKKNRDKRAERWRPLVGQLFDCLPMCCACEGRPRCRSGEQVGLFSQDTARHAGCLPVGRFAETVRSFLLADEANRCVADVTELPCPAAGTSWEGARIPVALTLSGTPASVGWIRKARLEKLPLNYQPIQLQMKSEPIVYRL